MEAVRKILSVNELTPVVDLPWKSKNMQVELIVMPLHEIASPRRLSVHPKITDLKGLGKEVWKNINVEDHLKKEREAWS